MQNANQFYSLPKENLETQLKVLVHSSLKESVGFRWEGISEIPMRWRAIYVFSVQERELSDNKVKWKVNAVTSTLICPLVQNDSVLNIQLQNKLSGDLTWRG